MSERGAREREMEEGGLIRAAVGEEDISGFLTSDSPFMKPEFVLDDEQNTSTAEYCAAADKFGETILGPSSSCPTKKEKLLELQHRLIQQAAANYGNAAPGDGVPAPLGRPLSHDSGSRPVSPFLKKPPKLIKLRTDEEDDSLYVKLEDLPQDVREQVRSMQAADEGRSTLTGSTAIGQGDCAHKNTGFTRCKLPFSEPTRLSAQPTLEEIQMCFAQVDLAILMETKPPRKRAGTPTSVRSASAAAGTTRPGFAHGCEASAASRRREKRAAGSQGTSHLPVQLAPKARPALYVGESDQSDSSFTPVFSTDRSPQPFANFANAQPPSRMQQVLIDLANSRRNSAAAAAAIVKSTFETDNELSAEYVAGKKGSCGRKTNPESGFPLGPPSWPPFAVSSDRSRRTSEQNDSQNLPVVREDFVHKLEQIMTLAAATGLDKNNTDHEYTDDAGEISCNGSKTRAYVQMPVWTQGGGGGRRSQEELEYAPLDPLLQSSKSRRRRGHVSAGDMEEVSTDTTDETEYS